MSRQYLAKSHRRLTLLHQKGINEIEFANIITKVSNLVQVAPEIVELDLNPLLGNSEEIFAVDARIKISKN